MGPMKRLKVTLENYCHGVFLYIKIVNSETASAPNEFDIGWVRVKGFEFSLMYD